MHPQLTEYLAAEHVRDMRVFAMQARQARRAAGREHRRDRALAARAMISTTPAGRHQVLAELPPLVPAPREPVGSGSAAAHR
jgi:hypothetical protein